jgi:hypothetical protein
LKKPDPVEQALDRLAALKNEAGSPSVVAELKVFLKNRSNLVAAKAAKIAGQSRATEVVPELLAAFLSILSVKRGNWFYWADRAETAERAESKDDPVFMRI